MTLLPDGGVITDQARRVVWDLTRFAFLVDERAEAPATVNPSPDGSARQSSVGI